MKKAILLSALVLFLGFGLTACGNGDEATEVEETPDTEVVQDEEVEADYEVEDDE